MNSNLSDNPSNGAVDFHSTIVRKFKDRYTTNANFRERVNIWHTLLSKYITPEMTAVDAGCGPGWMSFFLAERIRRVYGVDGSSEMLKLCEEELQETEFENLSFHQAYLPFDLDRVPFAEVDALVTSSVVEYVEEYQETLDNFRDMIRPEGIVILSMPNRKSLYRKLEKWVYRIFSRPSYYGFMRNSEDEQQLTKLMDDRGFDHLETVYYSSNYPFSGVVKSTLPTVRTHNLFAAVYRKRPVGETSGS